MEKIISTSLKGVLKNVVPDGTAVGQGIPIIFIHQHYSPYLEFTLRQAAYTNPTSPIHLVGDEENNRFPFLRHVPINQLRSGDFERFTAVYQHDSPNSYAYEAFCFQRWFLVKELMIQMGYSRVVVADSDLMIFSDLTTYAEELGSSKYIAGINVGADYQWVRSASGHSSFWTWEGINLFCELAIKMYSEPSLMSQLEGIRTEKLIKNDRAGISDMTALYLFYEQYGERIANLSESRQGTAFDHNICMATNFNLDEFETVAGRKKIQFKNRYPVGFNRILNQPITLHTLHFQGGSKNVVHRYYTGKGLWFQRVFREIRYRASRVYRSVVA